MIELIITAVVLYFVYRLYKKLTRKEKPVEVKKPERVYTDEEKKQAQLDFANAEKYYKSLKKGDEPQSDYVDCIGKMITAGELRSSSGKIVTESYLENVIRFREITDKCFEEDLNPRSKDDREIAEALLELEEDDEDDYDYSDNYDEPSYTQSKSSKSKQQEEYGSYVIQYRSGSTWIDGPGSNDERVAESMFDRFIETDPRGSTRARLVYKVNGRVKSVLSTN